MSAYQPISFQDSLILAQSIPENPETVIPLFQIQRQLAKVYLKGSVIEPKAFIIQAILDPGEPTAFGESAEDIWEVLKTLKDWRCVNVRANFADSLKSVMERDLGVSMRLYGDIYHTIEGSANHFSHPDVRRITPEDFPLIQAAESELKEYGEENLLYETQHGFVAGAVIHGKLQAIAHTSARTENYADIGVYTSPLVRKKGLSTAATSLVAQLVKAEGKTPTWSTGEDNYASLRVAEKVGFKIVSERKYLILPK